VATTPVVTESLHVTALAIVCDSATPIDYRIALLQLDRPVRCWPAWASVTGTTTLSGLSGRFRGRIQTALQMARNLLSHARRENTDATRNARLAGKDLAGVQRRARLLLVPIRRKEVAAMKRNELIQLANEMIEEAVRSLVQGRGNSDSDTWGPGDTYERSERGIGMGRGGGRGRGSGGGRGRGRGGGRGGRRHGEEWADHPEAGFPEQDPQLLREQAADMEQQLEWIRGRIKELEEGQQKKENQENQ